jgi:DNA-binding beta-propeller fold protein YncE
VNNTQDATLSVIDGNTDTTLATLPLGSIGPIQINPVTNIIYVVRLTGPGTDEVTYVNGDNDTYYTIATESFQPIAVAVNHVTNTIYAAHYATGDVRAISGAMTGNAHPATVSIGVWSRPFAVAANPVTNKVYVVTEDSRGPIAVINGADNTAVFPTLRSGSGQGPKAIAVDTVNNKVYAAFSGEIVVLDGATNALSYIPLGPTSNGPIEIGINHATNKVYVATSVGSLYVIDGATQSASAIAIPSGALAIAVNPITNKTYVQGDSTLVIDGAGTSGVANPIRTTITPLANNQSGADVTLTLTASSAFTPNAPGIRKVYYQLDSRAGAWKTATGSGPYAASFTGLSAGTHTLYAFATDGQDAPLYTSSASAPLIGTIAAYTFTVGDGAPPPPPPPEKAASSVSLTSSLNPSTSGQAVTFTAVVSGGAGIPTGTVTFRAGSSTITGCGSISLASGRASCSTSGLATGTHSITAAYGGDTAYNGATSGVLSQTVGDAPPPPPPPPPEKVASSVSLATSLNPSITGQAVTFTAIVSGNAGTASGTVAFRDGGTTISGCSAVSLASGRASCTTSALAIGTHSITAAYGGNTSYHPSTSGAITQTVNKKGNNGNGNGKPRGG